MKKLTLIRLIPILLFFIGIKSGSSAVTITGTFSGISSTPIVLNTNEDYSISGSLELTKLAADQVPTAVIKVIGVKSDNSEFEIESSVMLLSWQTSTSTTVSVPIQFNAAEFDNNYGKIYVKFMNGNANEVLWQSSNYNVNIQISNNTICCSKVLVSSGNPGSFSGTKPLGGDGSYSYQWYSSYDQVTWQLISGAVGQDYSNTSSVITQPIYYRRLVTSTVQNISSSFSNVVSVLVYTLTSGNATPYINCTGETIYVPFTTSINANAGNIFRAQLSDANGSFTNPIEIGSISAISSGFITSTIPNDALPGTGYRIRVVGSSPSIIGTTTPNAITVKATEITVSPLSAVNYCPNSQIQIPYTTCGYFSPSNIFTAQLSDQNGTFASPVNIGTLSSTGSGTIIGVIPAVIAPSENYRVRVVSSSPVVTGFSNTEKLSIGEMLITRLNGICKSATNVPLSFQVCIPRNSGNIFTAQISDANGSFASPTNIGTLSGTTSGSISISIPAFATVGGNHKIRIVSSSPSTIGVESTIPITYCGLTFDGINDQVRSSNSAFTYLNLNGGGTSSLVFTVEAWIKLASPSISSAPIFSYKSSPSRGQSLNITNNGTKVSFVSDGKTVSSNTVSNLYDNTCHHIAITYQGQNKMVTFYLDGNAVGSQMITGGGVSFNNADLTIGYDMFANTAFKGNINELRVWNVVRTPLEIQTSKSALLPKGTSGLLGYYQFQETDVQSIIDNGSAMSTSFIGNNINTDTGDPIRSFASCFSFDRIAADDQVLLDLNAEFYPNPFTDEVKIDLSSFDKPAFSSLKVVDTRGNVVLEKSGLEDQFVTLGKNLNEGIYLVHLYSEERVVVKKIVKIR